MEKLALLGDQEDFHKLRRGEDQREVICRRWGLARCIWAWGRGVSGGAKVPIPGVGQERGRCGKTGGGLGVGVTNSPVLLGLGM